MGVDFYTSAVTSDIVLMFALNVSHWIQLSHILIIQLLNQVIPVLGFAGDL